MNWNLLAVIFGSISITLDYILGITWFTPIVSCLVGMNIAVLIHDAVYTEGVKDE